jgi:hypothetical protein
LPRALSASGHGPVFAGATPTLGKGAWAVDQAWMCKATQDDTSDQLLRTMVSVGVTEDLQLSASLPIPLTSTTHMPTGRMMATMSGHRDVEGTIAWRFHRQPTAVGSRFESTAYFGVTMPLQNQVAGMYTTPSIWTAVASGYASRAHYIWFSGAYQRYTGGNVDRLGNVATLGVAYGYRPKFLRLDYPKPDLRFFVEALAEHTGEATHGTSAPGEGHHGGPSVPRANPPHPGLGGGDVVLVGPTALLLYKAYGLEAGVLVPISQSVKTGQPEERFRVGVNITYFFWSQR